MFFIWQYYWLSMIPECKGHWGRLERYRGNAFNYMKNPFYTGEDIVRLLKLEGIEISGTQKKVSIVCATLDNNDEVGKVVPFFWEKKPYHFNSYLIINKYGDAYRIPKKIWEEYLKSPSEKYEILFYHYEKLYGNRLDVLKHLLWKYFGYDFEWDQETTRKLFKNFDTKK